MKGQEEAVVEEKKRRRRIILGRGSDLGLFKEIKVHIWHKRAAFLGPSFPFSLFGGGGSGMK